MSSSNYACSSVSEMNYFADTDIPHSIDQVFMREPSQNEEFKEPIMLEPMPLATLPPEQIITDEEFEREVDLMMMDGDSMAVDISMTHDPEI